MSSAVGADLLAQLEAAVADPAKRARLIAAVSAVGGTSKRARAVKALAFGAAAVAVLLDGPFGMSNTVIAGAFVAAALAEVHG